jgi:hypothetical protein
MEVIEAARDHVLRQGAWATRENNDGGVACAYKTSDGRRCAIGGLPGFPAELDESRSGVGYLYKGSLAFRALFARDVTQAFLTEVQARLHDDHAIAYHIAYHKGGNAPFNALAVEDAAEIMLASIETP